MRRGRVQGADVEALGTSAIPALHSNQCQISMRAELDSRTEGSRTIPRADATESLTQMISCVFCKSLC